MTNYKEALKRPTTKGGRGWKYADNDSMQAAMSRQYGTIYLINPEAIYEWANKHNIELYTHETRKKLGDINDPKNMKLADAFFADTDLDDERLT